MWKKETLITSFKASSEPILQWYDGEMRWSLEPVLVRRDHKAVSSKMYNVGTLSTQAEAYEGHQLFNS